MTSTSTLPAPQKNPALQPDEPVWVRYSPHGELPLSSATSFVIHGLVIGLACLAIWTASRFLDHTTRSLPIQTVQLARDGDGDTGGDAARQDPGRIGLKEVGDPQANDPGLDMPDPDPARPRITPIPGMRTPIVPERNAKPTVQEGDSMAAFQALAQQGARMARASEGGPRGQDGPRSADKGPPGASRGKGPDGDGGKPMTRQEKRMARWAMVFDTDSGRDYVRQLAGLGAVLAVPVKEGRDGNEYQIVTNAGLRKPPARLVKEDLSKYKGIHWKDDDPKSVAQVMEALGLPGRPSHFIAFMPLELEDKLAKLEKTFAGRGEDDIHETRFKIKVEGNRYTPVVIDQTPRSAAPKGR